MTDEFKQALQRLSYKAFYQWVIQHKEADNFYKAEEHYFDQVIQDFSYMPSYSDDELTKAFQEKYVNAINPILPEIMWEVSMRAEIRQQMEEKESEESTGERKYNEADAIPWENPYATEEGFINYYLPSDPSLEPIARGILQYLFYCPDPRYVSRYVRNRMIFFLDDYIPMEERTASIRLIQKLRGWYDDVVVARLRGAIWLNFGFSDGVDIHIPQGCDWAQLHRDVMDGILLQRELTGPCTIYLITEFLFDDCPETYIRLVLKVFWAKLHGIKITLC